MYFGAFLLGLIREILRKRREPAASAPTPPFATPACPFIIPLALIGVLMLFAAQLWTIAFMAAHQPGASCWSRLAIPVVADVGEDSGGPALIVPSFLLVAYAFAQAALLWLIYATLRAITPNRALRLWLGCACAAGFAQAIFAPAMTSPDVYSYIAYAKLGLASYAAGPHVVSPEYLPVPNWCERGILPAAYGPAFIFYIKMLFALPHGSPVANILLLRASNAAWFALLLCFLRAAGASEATVAVAALNPAPLFQYVANAHNDVIAVALALGGIVLITRSTIAACLAYIAAALVKLPFIIIGAVMFTQLPSAIKRFSTIALSTLAALVLSYATAGPQYFAGLSYYNRLLKSGVDPLQYIAVAVVLWATFSALMQHRYNHISLYAFPALSVQTLMPWYAVWSLPYAVRESKHLASYLISMPLMLMLMETGIAHGAQLAAYLCVCAAIAVVIVRDKTG
jgi:hypothetical protein